MNNIARDICKLSMRGLDSHLEAIKAARMSSLLLEEKTTDKGWFYIFIDSTVLHVDIFIDGTVLHVDNSSEWAYNWSWAIDCPDQKIESFFKKISRRKK